MIPVLYSENEKEFKTQGLGCLTDAISCKVTEERNGSFELEMQYPIDGIHYSDIAYSRIITAVPADGEDPQPFEIYRITRPLNGKVTVYAQHISYRLSYTVTLPSTKSDNAADALKSIKDNAVTDCPFTFETDVVKAGSFINSKVQSIRALLGGQTGSILDCFGGEYKWDKWNVKLCDTRGSTLPISLEYGKNLTDLQQEENIESTYTAVICTWTSSDADNPTHVNGDIVYTDNWKSFPYVRTLVVDKSSDYENQPTKEDLTGDAEKYISANGVGIPKVSIKVSFINLADTEEYKHILPLQHINLCDTIRVRFPKLGVNASAKVIKTVYDVLGEKYTSLEVGDARTSLVSTTAAVSQEIEDTGKTLDAKFRSELKKQTDLITGGKGGYVVIRRDEETGYPDEILIMDQPDKLTAKNVIRMNKNGIGFSQNGYNGPFNSAWTIDSKFNADFIGTGILSDQSGNYSLNMESGKVIMKDAEFSGEIVCNKSSNGLNSGDGLYANNRGISIGQVSSWGGVPIFSVNLDNGESTPVRTTGIGFYHRDGSTFGYFYPWGTSTADGGLPSGHRLSARERGVQFNWDLRIDGNLYAAEVSSANRLYAMNGILANGNSEIGRLNGNTTLIGYEPGEGGTVLRVGSSGVSIKVGLNMNGYGIADCPSLSDENLKQNIEDLNLEKARRLIKKLRPKTFSFKDQAGRTRHGFIAQDLDKIEEGKDLVSHPKGAPLSIYYEDIIADLVRVMQEQDEAISKIEKKIESIGEKITTILKEME